MTEPRGYAYEPSAQPRPKVPAAATPEAMSRLPEIKERVALQRRIAVLEVERDNYKQKTEALIKSHHELNRMIDKLWAEVQGLREMFRKVQEALNPEPKP